MVIADTPPPPPQPAATSSVRRPKTASTPKNSMPGITHLQFLESEAIYVLREAAAQFTKPAMLFSGGKDSIVMAWLARKAFHPARIPFTLLHVDTGHNFPETLTYRDEFVEKIGARLL